MKARTMPRVISLIGVVPKRGIKWVWTAVR